MPSPVRNFLLQNAAAVIAIVASMFISLQVLETKFNTLSINDEKKQELLVRIEKNLQDLTLTVNDLRNVDASLNARLITVERYIPDSIVTLEKSLLVLSKDYELLEFKVGSYHPKPTTP